MASSFVATGQTGIVISGAGIALDRVIGDFMAGCVERVISETIEKQNPQWVVVEGQGSLLHPAYSGVTLSLIHGSAPDNMIFCHNPKYSSIKQYEKVMLPTVKRMIALYEEAAHWIKPAKVSAVALNTSGYPDKAANQIIHAMEAEVGLPVTDPIRYGPDRLVSALLAATDFKTTPP
jgi:uncharacterized NAD-dependent epimerase/dehydratase family protein